MKTYRPYNTVLAFTFFIYACAITSAYADGPCQSVYSITRNGATDSNDGRCSTLHCSLREAVLAANACPGSHTILLPSGTFRITIADANPNAPDDTGRTGDFDIHNNIVIRGQGANQTFIDGRGLHRIFDVRRGSLDLQSLTLIRGASLDQGLLSAPGGSLRIAPNTRASLINSNLQQNFSSATGNTSAIASEGTLNISNATIFENSGRVLSNGIDGKVTIRNSSFINNTGTVPMMGNGGRMGIFNSALSNNSVDNENSSSVLINSAQLILYESAVENNQGGRGALMGLSPASGTSNIEIYFSSIRGNTASSPQAVGGGLNNQGTTTIYRSVFENNHASFLGGSIAVSGTSANISESIIRNSTTDTTGVSAGWGGGIYAATLDTIINASLIEGNIAFSGGGIYSATSNPKSFLSNATRIVNSTIHGNTAFDTGGAVRSGFSASTGIKNSTITENYGDAGEAISVGLLSEMHVSHTAISNSNNPTDPECVVEGETQGFSVLTSYGFNLTKNGGCPFTNANDRAPADPNLGELASTSILVGVPWNQSPMMVRIPNAGSPLINTGDSLVDTTNQIATAGCTPYDARGIQRPVNIYCDIGAVEASLGEQ